MGKDVIILGGLLLTSYLIFGKKKTTSTPVESIESLNGGLNGNCKVCGSSHDNSPYLSVRGECRTGDNCLVSFPKKKTLLIE